MPARFRADDASRSIVGGIGADDRVREGEQRAVVDHGGQRVDIDVTFALDMEREWHAGDIGQPLQAGHDALRCGEAGKRQDHRGAMSRLTRMRA
jgi:hypothetical protein